MAVAYDNVTLVPNPKTADATAFVSNPDGILSSETVSLLDAQLYELANQTTAEVALVAVNSIGANEIEDFANSLFNHWGIGKAGKDNGVLILFVLDQRAVRFEVGYGLEGALPDAICKRIQTQVMIPEFKNENYDAGILAGVNMVIKIVKEEPVPELMSDFNLWNYCIGASVLLLVLFGLFPFLWLRRRVKKISQNNKYETNTSRYTAFKSNQNMAFGCSVFLLFPLFFFVLIAMIFVFISVDFSWKIFTVVLLPMLLPLFGGVIPVNIWAKRTIKKMRQAPIPCEACGGVMHILSEMENNHNLSDSQQFEKQLKSMDYDVFRCGFCQKEKVSKVELPSNKYSVCSKCGTKSSVKKRQKTIQSPTYSSTGIKEVNYSCLFCQHEETKQEIIPRLQHSSSGGSSSGGRSGGSFGGGRSGGGGSTSRW